MDEEDTCVEIPDVLDAVECRDLIGTIEKYASGASFTRVFAVQNGDLSRKIRERLVSKGCDMTDKEVANTWYYTMYECGESLSPHIDGHKRYGENRSVRTVFVYLNMHPEFEGGATRILDDYEHLNVTRCIRPVTGKAVVLSQDVLHEGAEVTRGTKYIARSDIIVRS
jgi:hypothetical protein